MKNAQLIIVSPPRESRHKSLTYRSTGVSLAHPPAPDQLSMTTKPAGSSLGIIAAVVHIAHRWKLCITVIPARFRRESSSPPTRFVNQQLGCPFIMPELPEVETLVRRLREPVVGRTIINVTVKWNAHDWPARAERICAPDARLHDPISLATRQVSGVWAVSASFDFASLCSGCEPADSVPIDSSQNEWQTKRSRRRARRS